MQERRVLECRALSRGPTFTGSNEPFKKARSSSFLTFILILWSNLPRMGERTPTDEAIVGRNEETRLLTPPALFGSRPGLRVSGLLDSSLRALFLTQGSGFPVELSGQLLEFLQKLFLLLFRESPFPLN